MKQLIYVPKTSIGTKVLMALTGLGLLTFVFFHMVGNLQVYRGADALNRYAEALREAPVLLWTARIGLLAVFLAHIVEGVRLKLVNRAARPVGYLYEDTVRASYASRSMMLTGAVILAFVIYHLLHFTFGVIAPDHFDRLDAQGRRDVYSMVIHGFRHPLIALTYIVAQGFLGMHLFHGASSLFHSLGLRHPRYDRAVYWYGVLVSLTIVAGNISIPLAVWLGWIAPLGGGTP
jgi:succinate dehydrogenase / fumarate reductase cytochrome b subunit